MGLLASAITRGWGSRATLATKLETKRPRYYPSL